MNECPACGSSDTWFVGIQDGCGDYGDQLCEEWECGNCGEIFEGMCEDEFYDDMPDLEDPDEPIDPIWSES